MQHIGHIWNKENTHHIGHKRYVQYIIAWYCMVLSGITWYLVFWGIWFISLMNRATAHQSFFHFIRLDLIYSVLCFYCPNVLFQCSLCVFYVICKSIHEVFNVMYSRAARIVAALQPGCEEMEREWGNEEEMEIEWGNKEEMEREWGNGEEMERDLLSTFPHSLFISSPSIHFLYQNLSHFVPKC